jgi:hypothetical protein
MAFRTAPRRPEQRPQNGPPHTGNNQKIAGSGDGKLRQERITLGINRISGLRHPPQEGMSKTICIILVVCGEDFSLFMGRKLAKPSSFFNE